METLTRSASVHYRTRKWRESGLRVALVPTGGTLHRGHMSLVAAAQDLADRVIVSIVRDPPEREGQAADLDLLGKIGADVAFVPPSQEMFPVGRALSAVVSVPDLADDLEGAARPGYLASVATLQIKLLNLVRPDLAVFGERDFQQLVMVRRLVVDLFLGIDIVSRPTWRDSDGMAIASVNRQLSDEQRAVAPRLHAILTQLAGELGAGARDIAALERRGAVLLAAAGFIPEYVQIRRSADLGPVTAACRDLVLLAAVRLDELRLIDNQPVRLIDHH